MSSPALAPDYNLLLRTLHEQGDLLRSYLAAIKHLGSADVCRFNACFISTLSDEVTREQWAEALNGAVEAFTHREMVIQEGAR